ncbi:hypothetical protein FQA39_LY11588 [Lamprigera yunnana]|nr:hypothetical protein FQA39_LY11588 [Lamprigera yunnana]
MNSMQINKQYWFVDNGYLNVNKVDKKAAIRSRDPKKTVDSKDSSQQRSQGASRSNRSSQQRSEEASRFDRSSQHQSQETSRLQNKFAAAIRRNQLLQRVDRNRRLGQAVPSEEVVQVGNRNRRPRSPKIPLRRSQLLLCVEGGKSNLLP